MPGVLGDYAWTTQAGLGLMAMGLALGALVVWLVLARRRSIRQRRIWILVAALVVGAAVVWDGIEVRFDGDRFYWRSDWDWELGGGGSTEWVAVIALFVVPPLASSLAYAGIVLAAWRRVQNRYARYGIYVLAAPLCLVLSIGIAIAIFAHPLLIYRERTSLAGSARVPAAGQVVPAVMVNIDSFCTRSPAEST